MRFLGLEEIQPYKNLHQFKIFEYDDEIDLNNKEKYICDLKVIRMDINEMYIQKGFEENIYCAIIYNLNKNIDLNELKEGIKAFILEEIPSTSTQSINIFKSENLTL
ncbi:hypothetical protein [Alkalithermobacter paradoxus]|uniref:Uncharacterized protein n=1 Tax=Alkalithermobacter paradoxus TaxID=29349 RepID=A0A1V4I8V0_9FIRM|nr:hypothetical protein CLOTH_07470 [[Clostridium] thermoalcaliphilum]